MYLVAEMVKTALDTRMRSGGLSLIRPDLIHFSKINTPEGLGRFAVLVVCRVTHAPYIYSTALGQMRFLKCVSPLILLAENDLLQ